MTNLKLVISMKNPKIFLKENTRNMKFFILKFKLQSAKTLNLCILLKF